MTNMHTFFFRFTMSENGRTIFHIEKKKLIFDKFG